jgi:hypothetical protein
MSPAAALIARIADQAAARKGVEILQEAMKTKVKAPVIR